MTTYQSTLVTVLVGLMSLILGLLIPRSAEPPSCEYPWPEDREEIIIRSCELDEEPEEKTPEQIIEETGEEVGLTNWEIEHFKKIAFCESTMNPVAISHTNDHGLFQINAYYHSFDEEQIYDPEYNTRYAMEVVYPAQGFNAWVCNKKV